MNGKKARALRRLKDDRTTLQDVQILQRQLILQQLQNKYRPKFKKLRVRKPAAGRSPTWPASKDQKAQSRPVIVMHPLRAIRNDMLRKCMPDKNGMRSLSENQLRKLAAMGVMEKQYIDGLAA